ncbi:phage repressor protein CI [Vibrio parahaemolyticus O5:K30]|uniref:phage repressor protein CI n=1 Tax=Vibrio harveyi group TaxID=717610 RepID=UPI00215B9BD8|nr:phage repressor protein CI [Vibrio parahaemolyticus]EJG0762264.1 phage repressor protein CI [Vibrio parahaemolyticus O5:K30]MCR9975696.1 helix-turn-helix domain-containing protein [Vibrio parahaemolyticus]MCS0019522.1 helix-turn-helix domain-containing protein [Vibrio parahaemolyticus]HBC0005036.1 phage repressor protein CI [Vibrio parahaemolyticus]HBN6187167.1 phage repressor protein CI [Vibrio parahaemolyticus]
MSIRKIEPFDYLKGTDFTENLKNLTGCKNFQEMAFVYGVPKSTFSTWNTHNRTSHELMVRAHLALGIPMVDLALKPKDRLKAHSATKNTAEEASTTASPQHNSVQIKSYCLTNGELLDTGELPYAIRRFNSFNLNADATIEVETNEALYLVDKSSTNPASGKYLIDIDGTLSINHIQRLPGKKLAVVFGDSTVDVSEKDIKVIGRVAVTLRKE